MRKMLSFALQRRVRFPVFLLAMACLTLPVQGKVLSHRTAIKWQPAKIVNGSPILFQIAAPSRAQKLSATWLGHQLNFFRSGESWYSLAGVPVETTPGTYELKLTETFLKGSSSEITRKIKVAGAVYPKITVSVAKKYT